MKINQCLLDKSKTYLIAVSGGVDSMSLLHFLHTNNYNVMVCHINHNTRNNENLLEQNCIQSFCLQNQLELFISNFKAVENTNFHQQARDFRMSTYKYLTNKYNLSGVIIAHHLDDVVENILLFPDKIGYRGIKEKVVLNNVTYIRPMLDCLKNNIYDYAKENQITFFEDSSNKTNNYSRNEIRNNVLLNFSVAQKKQLIVQEHKRFKHLVEYNQKDFLDNDYAQKQYYIYQLLIEHQIYNVPSKTINMIIKSYNLNGEKEFSLTNQFVLLISYGEFLINKKNKILNLKPKPIKKGYNVFNGLKFYCNYNNAYVRVREVGDKIVYHNFSKKVSRFMIDEKIPKHLRDIWPIIIDQEHNILEVPKRSIMVSDSKKYLKEILVSEQEIMQICQRMGDEITKAYEDLDQPVIFLGLLKGCHPFMSDLLKHIDLKLEIDYMDVSSFFGGVEASGEVQIIKDMTASVKGRTVVIVEDIVDSGRTIKKVLELLAFRGAKSVEVATLIDKPEGRTVELEAKFVGTQVPKAFIIGYGLDYKEYYRNLKDIGIPHDALIKE